VGWVVWRDPEYLPKELIFNINYLGADQASFTLNFSKGAAQVIGQYYQLVCQNQECTIRAWLTSSPDPPR